MFDAVKNFLVENAYTLELLLALAMFAYPFRRRSLFVLRLLICYAVLLAFSVLTNRYLPDNSALLSSIKYITMLVIGGGGIFFCVKASFWGGLFCVIGGSVTQHCCFRVVSAVLALSGMSYDTLAAFFIDLAGIAAVYGGVFYCFARKLRYNSEKYFENKYSVVLEAALVLFSIVLQFVTEIFVSMEQTPLLYAAIALYDIICCVFTLCLQYGMFRNNKLSNDMAIMKHLMYRKEEQYRISKDTIDVINVKCHDMKHRLSSLNDRIEPEELKSIKEAINIYDNAFKTGNDVLDVFLMEKSLYYKKYDIKLDCIIDGESVSFMSSSDIYSLFGNALDNAFDALVRIEEPEKRIVCLSVKKLVGMIVIHIENNFTGELRFAGELPETTKSDHRYHGFGMRSIKLIVDKYRGNVSVRAENGVFNLNILIPPPMEKG